MDKKPYHLIIRQYRVYSVLIVAFFMWLAAQLVVFLEDNHATMNEAAAAGVVSLALAVVGAIVKGLESFTKRTERDEE